jgi:iron(III) transport system substrate-binding protein
MFIWTYGILHGLLVMIISILLFTSCQNSASEVIVYTAVDQPYSEPILRSFEESTGIEVKAVYDVEAAKTTGLVNRLIAERESPKADVFWNNEILQSILLQKEGILQPYISPNAKNVPGMFRDQDGYWTGVTARARVFIINKEKVEDPSQIDSMYDLLDVKWMGNKIGIAYPLFGTTSTHAAALYDYWGESQAKEYFQDLYDRDIRVVDGNSVVRDQVSNGDLFFGLTDTDDACTALNRGKPVMINLPDQNSFGTLVIPSTVGLIGNSPNPQAGKALIDFLLLEETEISLLESGFSHIPLHTGIPDQNQCLDLSNIKAMDINYENVYSILDLAQEELREIFIR